MSPIKNIGWCLNIIKVRLCHNLSYLFNGKSIPGKLSLYWNGPRYSYLHYTPYNSGHSLRLLCLVVVLSLVLCGCIWSIYTYLSLLFRWNQGIIAPLPDNQLWKIWVRSTMPNHKKKTSMKRDPGAYSLVPTVCFAYRKHYVKANVELNVKPMWFHY